MAKPCRRAPRRRRHERNARSGKEVESNTWREVLCAAPLLVDLTGNCAAWRSHAAGHPLVAARQTARASVLRRTRVKYACRSSSRKSLREVNLFREYCGTFYGGTSATRGAGKKLRVTRGAKYSAQVYHIGTIRTGIGRHLPRSILGGCLCIFEENPDLIVEHVIFSIRARDIPPKAARARSCTK